MPFSLIDAVIEVLNQDRISLPSLSVENSKGIALR